MDSDNLFHLYFVQGSSVTNITIVFNADEMQSSEMHTRTFKPDMTHQVYGQREMISGYRNLQVNIYVTANSAKMYYEINYTAKANSVIVPDDVYTMVRKWLPKGFITNKEDFMKEIQQQKPNQMFGSVLDEVKLYHDGTKKPAKYTFNHCSVDEKGFEDFHYRFQHLLVWFIDAASVIDVQDPNWTYIYVFEEHVTDTDQVIVTPVGFCTVYKYFSYPDKTRARISQFFIIPPCQKMGLGTRLLQNVYSVIQNKMPEIVDITVEDPSPVFTRMRDLLDLSLVMKLDTFGKTNTLAGHYRLAIEQARQHFKLGEKQTIKLFHILRAYYKQEPLTLQETEALSVLKSFAYCEKKIEAILDDKETFLNE